MKVFLKKRIESFKYAFNGLKILIINEHNARIHMAVAIIVIITGILLKLSATEWIIIAICISGVFTVELINTAIETISDFISPGKHDMIKKIKDLSAAAVLVWAFATAIIGLIIFLPKLIVIFS